MTSTFRLVVQEPGVNIVVMITAENEVAARSKLEDILAQTPFQVQDLPGTSPSDALVHCAACLAPAVVSGRCHRHLFTK